MMMSAADACRAAQSVLPGTPEHAAACEICAMRGFAPDQRVTSVQGIPPVANWQWIIAEQILEVGLRHMLARGAKMASMPMRLDA